MKENRARPRLLAISSGGGHWVELRRLTQAFEGCETVWCATHPDYADELFIDVIVGKTSPEFHYVQEAIRWQRMRMVQQFFGVLRVLWRVRPSVIVSTGASPGAFAICFGKVFLRSKTIWVQSIADAESMSMSGRLVRPFSDLWLTQWEHLAKPKGPYFHGAVI